MATTWHPYEAFIKSQKYDVYPNQAAKDDAEVLSFVFPDMMARFTDGDDRLVVRFSPIDKPPVRVLIEFPADYGVEEEDVSGLNPETYVPRIRFVCPSLSLDWLASLSNTAQKRCQDSPRSLYEGVLDAIEALRVAPVLETASEFVLCRHCNKRTTAELGRKLPQPGLHRTRTCLACNAVDALPLPGVRRRYTPEELLAISPDSAATMPHPLIAPPPHPAPVEVVKPVSGSRTTTGARRLVIRSPATQPAPDEPPPPLESAAIVPRNVARAERRQTRAPVASFSGCCVCFDPAEGGVIMVDICTVGCMVCVDCLPDVLRIAITSRRMIRHVRDGFFTITCPVHDDSSSALEDRSIFALGAREEVLQMHRFAFEDGAVSSGGFVCPHQGCSNRPFFNLMVACISQCPECSRWLCSICRQAILECACDYRAILAFPELAIASNLYAMLDEHALDAMQTLAYNIATPRVVERIPERDLGSLRFNEDPFLQSAVQAVVGPVLSAAAARADAIRKTFADADAKTTKAARVAKDAVGTKPGGTGRNQIHIHVMQRERVDHGYKPVEMLVDPKHTIAEVLNERRLQLALTQFLPDSPIVGPPPGSVGEVAIAWGQLLPTSATIGALAAAGPVVIYMVAVFAPSLPDLASELELLSFRRTVATKLTSVPMSDDMKFFKKCPFCGSKVVHYFRHGCHVIGGAHDSCCGQKWCYVCVKPITDAHTLANTCPTFCLPGCACPPCMDCTSSHRCEQCTGCPRCF